jgi:molybdate transport system substrate-binding protein
MIPETFHSKGKALSMTAARSRRRFLALVAGLAVGALPPGPALAAREVLVFAAASLKTAMDEVAERYAQETGNRAILSFAGSSALARQIEQGAPADIFLSANRDWMDRLEQEGLVDPGARFDLLTNSLVLIAHGTTASPVEIGAGMDLAGLLGDGRLAMALVDAVPAGIYGKAALISLDLWNSVAPNIAQTDNVRAALALVSSGEAPLGIVYASDAAADGNVTVIGTFPADSHPPIVYPAAALARASESPAAADFLAYLRRPSARAAFRRQGFGVIE